MPVGGESSRSGPSDRALPRAGAYAASPSPIFSTSRGKRASPRMESLAHRCYPRSLRKPVTPRKPAPRWLLPALLALTALLLLGLFSTEISDPDFWWHLKTGQYIVTEHRAAGARSVCVHHRLAAPVSTGRGRYAPLQSHPRMAGAGDLVPDLQRRRLSRRGALEGAAAGRFCAASRVGWHGVVPAPRLWGLAAALAAAALAIEFARDRPGILSYVFTAAFMAILESRRRLWLLPVLAMVWANCHGGFFLGWVVCGAYCRRSAVRRAPDARRILLASGLAVVLSGLNPNGFAALATVLRYRHSPLQATLIEWSRADLWGPPYAFDLLLYGAALALLLAWKRVRPADWILFAAFAARRALLAFRNEMLVGLLAPVLIAAYFPWKRRLPALAQYAGVLALGAGWCGEPPADRSSNCAPPTGGIPTARRTSCKPTTSRPRSSTRTNTAAT